MRINVLPLVQFFVVLLVLLFSVIGRTLYADDITEPIVQSLETRHKQQKKRRLDDLQKQQERSTNIMLQPELDALDLKTVKTVEKPCFVIQVMTLEGASYTKFEFALESLLEDEPDQLGQCLGVNGINNIINKIQNRIIQKGYVTTRVMVEPQNLENGELKLTVIPGEVKEISVAGGSDPRFLGTGLPVREGDILNIRDIEQGIENLTRVPTVDANVDIKPAGAVDAKPGQSDLIVHHSQPRPFRLTLGVDDSGYDTTGRYQGVATLSLDNPLGLNDLFYVSLNRHLGHAENDGGTDGYSVHYSLPFGYWLFSATSSEHKYWQNVAGLNQSYEYSGKSRRDEVSVSRVVFRDSRSKLNLGLKAYKTSSRNYIEDTEIDVQHRRMSGWVAQLKYQLFIKQSVVDFGLAFQRGTGAFDALPAPEATFDEGTARPKIITANLNVNYAFELGNQAFNFSSYWEAQWNKTTLVPQDRFSIGGRYTVRGFDGESTLLAERGWFSRNTVSMRLADTQHQFYTGIDLGHVSGQSADLLLGKRLAGWVVGITGHWKRLMYDLFAGTPLDKPKGFEAGRTLGFNLTYQY